MASYLEQEQEKLWSLFTEAEQEKIREIREQVEILGRHPLVQLLFCSDNNQFATQHLANLLTGVQMIQQRWTEWHLSASDRKRLVDLEIDTCSSVLGELKVFGYLIEAFPDTRPVPTTATKTPDFEVKHHQRLSSPSVFVEVHSKAWSSQMHNKMKQHQRDFHDGVIGGEGPVRVAEMMIEPFAGAKKDSQTEDGVSKIASIGQKACQIPEGHAGLIWLNLEQFDLDLILSVHDTCPLYSMGRGDCRSGIIWNALYGVKHLPLYEVYPDRPVKKMQHDGMFASSKLSAVAVNFGREIMLFENPIAETPLPDWFRTQFFNVKWFCSHYSRLQLPGCDLAKLIDIELQQCRALEKVDIIANW